MCVVLLAFLAVYLTVTLGWSGGRAQGEQTGMGELWSGRRVLLAGCAQGLYEPADGSQENMSFILQNILPLPDTGDGSTDETVQLPQNEWPSIAKQNVLCRLQKGQLLPRAGSSVTVKGVVRPFLGATNPGEFDAAAYYAAQGVCFLLQDVQIVTQGDDYNRLDDFYIGVSGGLQRCMTGFWGKGTAVWRPPWCWASKREWMQGQSFYTRMRALPMCWQYPACISHLSGWPYGSFWESLDCPKFWRPPVVWAFCFYTEELWEWGYPRSGRYGCLGWHWQPNWCGAHRIR